MSLQEMISDALIQCECKLVQLWNAVADRTHWVERIDEQIEHPSDTKQHPDPTAVAVVFVLEWLAFGLQRTVFYIVRWIVTYILLCSIINIINKCQTSRPPGRKTQ